jgi:hypothetical protein
VLHDLLLLDGQREQVDALKRADLPLLHQPPKLRARHPLLLLRPSAPPAPVASPVSTPSALPSSPPLATLESLPESPPLRHCSWRRRAFSRKIVHDLHDTYNLFHSSHTSHMPFHSTSLMRTRCSNRAARSIPGCCGLNCSLCLLMLITVLLLLIKARVRTLVKMSRSSEQLRHHSSMEWVKTAISRVYRAACAFCIISSFGTSAESGVFAVRTANHKSHNTAVPLRFGMA